MRYVGNIRTIKRDYEIHDILIKKRYDLYVIIL